MWGAADTLKLIIQISNYILYTLQSITEIIGGMLINAISYSEVFSQNIAIYYRYWIHIIVGFDFNSTKETDV